MITCKDQCLLITYQKKQRKFFYDDILSITHEGGITYFHLKNGKVYLIPGPFKDFYQALSDHGFERNDRCQMINLRYIDYIDCYSKTIHLTQGKAIKTSRRCLKLIQESWENF